MINLIDPSDFDKSFNVQKIQLNVGKKMSANDFSGKSNKNPNQRVVHFPEQHLEYEDDSDDRTNPLTNQTITSGNPKLPIPKMKQMAKDTFEKTSKPI